MITHAGIVTRRRLHDEVIAFAEIGDLIHPQAFQHQTITIAKIACDVQILAAKRVDIRIPRAAYLHSIAGGGWCRRWWGRIEIDDIQSANLPLNKIRIVDLTVRPLLKMDRRIGTGSLIKEIDVLTIIRIDSEHFSLNNIRKDVMSSQALDTE